MTKSLLTLAFSLCISLACTAGSFAQSPRPWLHELSEQDLGELSALILSFLTDDEIHWHMNIRHEQADSFFLGHNAYIRRLESYLQRQGADRFVPLPKWDPARPVPGPFTLVRYDYQPLQNIDVMLPVPMAFRGQRLQQFDSIESLFQAIRPYHDEVHNQLGGCMGDVMTAPGAPIFFCWHALLDDLFAEWASITGYEIPGPMGNEHPTGVGDGSDHGCICGPNCRCGPGCQCPRRQTQPPPQRRPPVFDNYPLPRNGQWEPFRRSYPPAHPPIHPPYAERGRQGSCARSPY